MNYQLNSYAVVEDASGLHLVPSYTRGRYQTVLVDASTVANCGRYLGAYAAVRGVGDSHANAHAYALLQIGRSS